MKYWGRLVQLSARGVKKTKRSNNIFLLLLPSSIQQQGSCLIDVQLLML